MPYQFEKSGMLKKLTAEELAAADGDSAVIVLSSGMLENGTPYWVYIAVKPSRYEEFLKVTAARQPLCIDDYGVVLKYGLDKEVPAAIKEEMKREHGCDDNYLATLTQDIKKAQSEFLKEQEEQKLGDIVAMLKKEKPDESA
jgi:hypothetical protein